MSEQFGEEQLGEDLSDGQPVGRVKRLSEEWWASRPPHVQARRCTAKRSDRTRQCRRVAWLGGTKCGHHGAKTERAKAKARRVIEEAQANAANRLVGFAMSDKVPAYVALQATQDLLDRGGTSAPKQVNVDVNAPWAEVFDAVTGIAPITLAESRALRGLPAPEPLEVVDAELVDPPEDTPTRPAEPQMPQGPTVPPQTALMSMEEANASLRDDLRRRR